MKIKIFLYFPVISVLSCMYKTVSAQESSFPKSVHCINFSEKFDNSKDTLYYSDGFKFNNHYYKLKSNTHFTDSIILDDTIVLSTSLFYKNIILSKRVISILDNQFNLISINSKSEISKSRFQPGFKIIGNHKGTIYFSSGPLINQINNDTLICNSILTLKENKFETLKLKESGKTTNLNLKKNIFMYPYECIFISDDYKIFNETEIATGSNQIDSTIIIYHKKKKYNATLKESLVSFKNLFEFENELYLLNEKDNEILKFECDRFDNYISFSDLIPDNNVIYDYLFKDGFIILLYKDKSLSISSTARALSINLKTKSINTKILIYVKNFEK